MRSTEPKLQHPTNPALLRQLTPAEHARVKGNAPILIEDMAATRAHEVLGQSVLSAVFRAVAKALGVAIRCFTPQAEIPAHSLFVLAA